jgi:probable rRNA maturation factor
MADLAFVPKNKKILRKWMQNVAHSHHFNIEHLNFIFCSDVYLLKINQQFLKHDTYTDIITFDYGNNHFQKSKAITGEIYISVERIKENARKFKTSVNDELHRVMIHGVLHLCGFKDKKVLEKKAMRAQEDIALRKLKSLL